MQFTKTPIPGAYLVEIEKREDERGFFGRAFCRDEFAANGIESAFVQANNSASFKKGTLRGLHFQLEPASETKFIRCIKGSIFDVVLDMRKDSPTQGQWFSAILTAENRRSIVIPRGCAHGFMTLEDDSEVFYLVSNFYSKDLERGVRWDDPAFGIKWPMHPTVISDRDQKHPYFDPAYHFGAGI